MLGTSVSSVRTGCPNSLSAMVIASSPSSTTWGIFGYKANRKTMARDYRRMMMLFGFRTSGTTLINIKAATKPEESTNKPIDTPSPAHSFQLSYLHWVPRVPIQRAR